MGTDTLNEFKSRRELWIECLLGDDRNSIKRQIWRMVWNTAAFRAVNEGRRIAPPANEGGVQVNGLMHRLLDEGFFESQMSLIRRLTDIYPITGDSRNRDVFSLTSLLKDMQEHAHLITRGNMFSAEGLEYDVDRVRQKWSEYARQKIQEGQNTYFVPNELDWHRLEERHGQIDYLAGVSSKTRSPDDAVRPAIMLHLQQKVVTPCKGVRTHVDKFIAHAARPGSRQAVNADNVNLTLNHLYQAHEAICKVASFVGVYLLGKYGPGPLAIPQFDQFAYIDKPLVTKEGIESLKQAWDEYEKETQEWTGWGIGDFRKEFEPNSGT